MDGEMERNIDGCRMDGAWRYKAESGVGWRYKIG
jgi:hypothetical protein